MQKNKNTFELRTRLPCKIPQNTNSEKKTTKKRWFVCKEINTKKRLDRDYSQIKVSQKVKLLGLSACFHSRSCCTYLLRGVPEFDLVTPQPWAGLVIVCHVFPQCLAALANVTLPARSAQNSLTALLPLMLITAAVCFKMLRAKNAQCSREAPLMLTTPKMRHCYHSSP